MLQSHSPTAQRTDCPNRRAPAVIPRLQVVDDVSPPRVVRISTRRCTVGGAPSCTVRLRAFGVRPLHCVIQQYRDRTLVRSLCPGNRLNGQPFRQERLQHGDTLALGPITFRVLLDDDSLAEPLDHRPQAAGATTPASCPPVNPADELPDAFLARIERLEDQLAKMERRAEGASGAATETVPSSVVANLVAELARQRDDLGHQRLEWAEQKQRLDHSLAERMNRLSELESQLTAQQQNRLEVEAAFDRTRVRLAELEDALEQSRQCLQSEQHEYGQQRNAWQTLRGQLEAELAESRHQWADLVRQVELYQQQSQQDRDHWQAAEARLAEVRQQLEELTADFQRQRTEYEQQSTLWVNQKQSLETQLEATLQSADQERLAHAAATEQWQRQCHELEARLESQHAVLAQQQQQLSELATLRERILHKCDEQQATIEQLLSRCAELETEAARALADTQNKQDWERQRAEFLQQQSMWELDRSNLLGELEARERQISDQRAAIQQIESASQDNYRQWEEERGQLLEQLQQAIAAQQSYLPLGPAAALAETLPAEPAVPLDSDLPSIWNDGYGSDDLSRVEDVSSGSCRAAEVLDGPVESAEQVRAGEATNRLEPQDEGSSQARFAVEPESDWDSDSESNPRFLPGAVL